MQCLGRTKNLGRCKNRAKFLVCHRHTLQLVVLLLITIPGLSVTYNSVYKIYFKPIVSNPSSRFQTMVVDGQSGVGIGDVTVKLLEVDGKQVQQTIKTASDGRFVFKVSAEAGTKIRLSFDHPQYKPYNDYYETENAKTIKLDLK